ncbi:MAG TPA: choice-of-anchor D domain-containing protein, partial [bacterium]|nr:choice-of-anchor D domain-containing protein [bacterium]
AFGTRADTLAVNSNSGLLRVGLSGTGTPGVLMADIGSYDFGNVYVGDSAQTTIRLYSQNGAVDVSSISHGTSFFTSTIQSGPTVLFNGDTLTLQTKFKPGTFAGYGDTLYAYSNSQSGLLKLALSGTGTPGSLVALTTPVHFGNLVAGDSIDATLRFVAQNGAVQVAGASFQSGAFFKVTTPVGTPLLSIGDTLKVKARYTAQNIGTDNDNLIVTSNASTSPNTIAVSGSGFAGTLIASSYNANFGSLQVGDSLTKRVRIYGTSNGLQVTGASLQSGANFTYTTSQALPVTLNLGDTLNVDFTFRPSLFVSYTDTADFVNTSAQNPVRITLMGQGAVGAYASTLSPFNFGLVFIGDSTQKTMKIYSTSGATQVDSLKLKSGVSFRVIGTDALPMALLPGDSLDVVMEYEPVERAPESDTLWVYGNAGLLTIPVAGTGNTGALAFTKNWNMGALQIGDSLDQAVKVYNTGGNVTITDAKMEVGKDFRLVSLSHTLPALFTSSDTLIAVVRFKPSNFGSRSDRLVLSNNTFYNPEKVNFSGSGAVGTLAYNTTGVNFGNVLVTDSMTQSFKIYAGSGRVVLQGLSLDQNYYTVTSNTTYPDTLSAGDTVVVSVKFKPATVQSYGDTLRILNNGTPEPLALGITGSGAAGTIASNVTAVNFPLVKVGGVRPSQRVKLYTNAGQVLINDLTFGVSGVYDIITRPSLPKVLNAGDTLAFDVRFTPSTGMTYSDTLFAGNNSGVAYLITLQGTAFNNSSPNVFTLKSPSSSVVNTRKPQFSWQGNGDPDGDAVGYTLQISHSPFFDAMALSAQTTDTNLTIANNLDSIGHYYWRVIAEDGEGGSRISAGAEFTIDAVSPEVYVGVLPSTVLKSYLAIYAYANETLNTLSGVAVLNDATTGAQIDSSAITLSAIAGQPNLYETSYTLSSAGVLTIRVTGVDTAGNSATGHKLYTVTTIGKTFAGSVSSADKQLTLLIAKGSINRDGMLLITKDDAASGIMAKALSKLSGEAGTGEAIEMMAAAGEGYTILSSGGALVKAVSVSVRYSEEAINNLKSRYMDFDERKIGLYREDNGQWIYEGGEGQGGAVTASLKSLGKVKLFYNDTHVFVPKSLELSQNYPNPFNPTTTIRFGLPQEGRIKLVIYNVLGQKVRELYNGTMGAGFHTMLWDGRNAQGQMASSGVYIYRLESAQGVLAKKMTLIK